MEATNMLMCSSKRKSDNSNVCLFVCSTFEEEETFPSTSIERCVRHGIVLPSSAHENVDVGNTLGGGNRYHHHHQHTHTSSKDGENPSPFSSTHKYVS